MIEKGGIEVLFIPSSALVLSSTRYKYRLSVNRCFNPVVMRKSQTSAHLTTALLLVLVFIGTHLITFVA